MRQSDELQKNDNKTICVSVFKSGENTTTTQEYTRKWIELINQIERDKSQGFCKTC